MCVAVDDGYQSLSSDCVKKRAAVRQLKLQMQQLEMQRTTSHERIDAHVQQLVVSLLFIMFSTHSSGRLCAFNLLFFYGIYMYICASAV